MKTAIILCAPMLLMACASFQQAVSGYNASAVVTVQTTDDNAIKIWTEAACATPVGAVIRHPEIVAGVKAICLPGGSTNAGTLLDAIPQAPAK